MIDHANADDLRITMDEALDAIEDAAGMLSVAEEALKDMSAIFEAIVAATKAGSLARRLADYGARTSEHEGDNFGGYKRDYNKKARQFLDGLHASKNEEVIAK